jgi:hypothetical protein
MDILTLELFDVTVSEALREINRALEEHPSIPLRLLLGGESMLHHNIQRFLERQGRTVQLRSEGGRWRMDVGGAGPKAAPPPQAAAPLPLPAPLAPARKPLLLTSGSLGQGGASMGRRLLLGVLRELDPAVPWVGLALEALDLLEDPQALEVLATLQGRGIPVRISRESQLFPTGQVAFEIMEDTQWQRLAGRGEITIL